MRNKRYVLFTVLGIVASVFLLVFGLVSLAKGPITSLKESFESPKLSLAGTVEIPLEDFDKVEVEGFSKLIIEYSPENSISFYQEAKKAKELYTLRKGHLKIESPSNPFSGDKATILIKASRLSDLKIEGAGTIEIKNFEQKKLAADISGAAKVSFISSNISEFILKAEGAVSIDCSTSSMENAKLSVAGASNLVLNMNGGILDGKIEGVSHLEYSGILAENKLKKDGDLVTIEYKE